MNKRSMHKGFVIPLVVITLFIAAVFGTIYNQSIRAQRRLDLMFEHDLRSFYIAQSGFQSYASRIQSLANYESRWYPGKDFSEKQEYFYQEEKGLGYYFVYASEVSLNQKFQHIFVLSKGIYEDSQGNKNLTLVKANISFDPAPPTPQGSKVKTFITNKSSINKRQLMEFVKEAKFANDFKNASSEIQELIDFLKNKKVADIDFLTQKKLLQAMAELNAINQKIRKRLRKKRIALDLKKNGALQRAFDHAAQLGDSFSAHTFAALFHNIDSSSNEEIDGKHLSDEELQKAEVRDFLNSLASLPDELALSINDPSKLPFPIHNVKNLNNSTFIELLQDFVKDQKIEKLSDLVSLLNESNARVSLGGDEVQLSSIAKILSGDDKIVSNPDTSNQVADHSSGSLASNSSVNGNGTGPGYDESSATEDPTYESDSSEDPEQGDPENGEEILQEELDDYMKDGKNPPMEFISDLVGDELASSIDWTNPGYENDSSKTYVKIFTDRALKSLRVLNQKRQLENFAGSGEGLSAQEMKAEFKKLMPDIEYIRKVGVAIDKIHNSKKFDFYFNAHVMDPYKGNSTRKWKQIDIPHNSWKSELYTKMIDISPSRLPKTNKGFLEVFTRSTWGDSDAAKIA
ncbi:hypothetical protein MJH12_01450, partial [bacterium]|nr:hypothetical protein [bacterium]